MSTQLPNQLLAPLLPLYGISVELTIMESAEFSFFHQMTVDAFTRHCLESPEDYQHCMTTEAPESGRLIYHEDDPYCFSVLSFAGKTHHLHRLMTRLNKLPDSAPIKDKASPLRNNLRLNQVNDLTTNKPVRQASHLAALTHHKLLELLTHYQNDLTIYPQSIQIQWLSPARLLRASEQRSTLNLTGEAKFCRDKTHLTPQLFVQRVLESLTNLINELGFINQLTDVIDYTSLPLEQSHADIFWVDTPYFSKDKQDNTAGGIIGQMTITQLAPINPVFWQALILGQYIGVGQRRISGFGKYQLNLVPNDRTTVFHTPDMFYRHQRAQTLLTKALMPNNIQTAIEALEDKTKQDNLGQKLEAQLFNGITQLHQNHYQPPPLFGQEIPKRNGKTRLLAVAPVYDRILQKAVALQLTPSIDAILDQRSFAYRKGKSRLQIKSDINQAVKQGYRWIYESDIKNFFDAIDREQLKKRLIALFGQDPIFDAVINWLAADLLHNGQRIPRPLGVPQGSPLSPLVSNFVLDDFDSDLEAKGFKLIRYADDFVILCKNEEEATLAAAEVNRSLQEIGLQINGEKSHIINIEQGFRFVGFMFQDEWGVDVSHQRNPQHTPLVDKADDDLSDWDDDVPPWEEPSVSVSHDNDLIIDNTPPWETPQDSNLLSDETPEGHNEDDDEGHDHNAAAFGLMPEEGSFFTLAGESSMLSLSNGRLVVKQDEIVVQSISLTHLSGVLLFGNHHLTTPLIKACLAAQIPIHLASRMGNYEGAIWKRQPIDNSYKGWFKQMAYFDSSDSALYLAKLTVESRITNILFILQRYNTRPEIRALIQQITASKEKVSTCDNAQSLLGYEGNASKNLFAALAYLLPEWCAFTGRNRRPPKDPYNVLLSYGYTWLYAHVDAILTARGFLTWKGYYHQPSSGHAALASDILESYRHLIERTSLTAVNNKMIKLEDFRIEDEQLRLSSDARKKYLSLLETYFLKPKNGLTIWQHIHAQARNLWQNIHHQAPYLPFVEK